MMLRWLYIRLLWMHPPRFRSRFCDEMLDDFDVSAGRGSWRLLGDAAVSVFRQWVLRPEFHDEPATALADSAVMFHSLEDYKPQGSALMYGSALSIGSFLLVVFALAHSNAGRVFSIGIQRPGLGLIPIDRSAFTASEHALRVDTDSPPEDPIDRLALFYFRTNPVAKALDEDGDLAIAGWEMILAPRLLLKLDHDHDGQLSAQECGFRTPSTNQSPQFRRRARASFMQVHPLPAALDADQDAGISGVEIRNSSALLLRADRNRDGYLSAIEVMPEPAVELEALIRLRLDTNGDGRISAAESSTDEAGPVRGILESADANRDGAVTGQELRGEIARRLETRRQLQKAAGSSGYVPPRR